MPRVPTSASTAQDATWETLQSLTSGASLSSNSRFEIPDLRVGTLDTLMALSDDLSKTSTLMEVVVAKIRRQVSDIGGGVAVGSLKVEGLPAEAYLTRFKWDEAKFPMRRPLKETVEKISEIIGRIEDDLKVCFRPGAPLHGYAHARAHLCTVGACRSLVPPCAPNRAQPS